MKSKYKKHIGIVLPKDILIDGEYIKTKSYSTQDNYIQETTPSYVLWKAMHFRIRNDPTYYNVSVEFCDFQSFAVWCNSQIGYGLKDEKGRAYQLDKDILFPGNRSYSEGTCCFIPNYLNAFFRCGSGVAFHSLTGKYQATIQWRGRSKYLGLFHSFEEARYYYLKERLSILENLIKSEIYASNIMEGLSRHRKEIQNSIQIP